MPNVELIQLTKCYNKATVVDHLNLLVQDGELLTLLGPSGCGKTTTLRCIAGFTIPDSGKVVVGGKETTTLPPEKRDIGFVFQNYALWPHMTVFQNLAFGLRLRKIRQEEIKNRIQETLSLVGLSKLGDRYPYQLSGGQQQRVALARALILHPQILLLDEPLSNLDAKLREQMRFEIRELQKQLKITTIYVTHDQAEALVISDRVAILNSGRLMQVGTPQDIYEKPSNYFVADFMGITSFIDARVEEISKEYVILKSTDGLIFQALGKNNLVPGQGVLLASRPEQVEVLFYESPPRAVNTYQAEVKRIAYLGNSIDCQLKVGQWDLRVNLPPSKLNALSKVLWVRLLPERLIIVPKDSEPKIGKTI